MFMNLSVDYAKTGGYEWISSDSRRLNRRTTTYNSLCISSISAAAVPDSWAYDNKLLNW